MQKLYSTIGNIIIAGSLLYASTVFAMQLDAYKMATAQPLRAPQHAIIGQWTCQYQQQYAGGVVMETTSVDDYFANGLNRSKTRIELKLPNKTVEYAFESRSDWQLLSGDILDHQNWQLEQFSVSDPQVEQQLKLRESLLKKSQFKTQIIQVNAHQAVVRGLDTASAVNQETTCYR